MATGTTTTQRKVPTYCYQCVAGPDLLNVVVEDGVAVKVEPNFGVKEHPAGGRPCVHSEHLYGEYWHRAFTVAPDMPNNTYVLSFGNNGDVSGGVIGIWRHAEARGRGATWIQFEPHLSVTAATAAEWVPIKPKTDAAVLYAIIHTTLHEHDWRRVCDIGF